MPFTRHLRYTLQSLWFYAPSVLTILIGYFLLTKLTQGQDVVMLVGEAGWPVLFTAIGVMLWAFFVWYCSRLLGYEKKFNDPEWPLEYLSLFPRLLAYNTFVTVQAAIVALPTVGSDNAYFLWAFVILHNGYYFILNSAFKTKKKAMVSAAIVIAAIYLGYLIYLFFHHKNGAAHHQLQLPWVGLLLFGLQILALYFFIQRRASINKNAKNNFPNNAIDYVSVGSIKIIKVPAWLKAQEQHTFIYFNIMAGLAIALYFVILNSVGAANGLGPLPVLVLAFGILAGLATLITYFSMRVKFSLFFVLLVIAIVAGNFFDPYSVKLTKTEKRNAYQHRPTLEEYLENWVAHRKKKIDQIDSPNTYPVYLVLADGGASRSGYWAASVLAAWQKESLANVATTGTLNDHLLVLSGASGGSVGNAAFYGLLKNNESDTGILKHAQDFLGRDFLTYTIAHYLGSDLAGHFIPGLRDRATALSNNMDYWSDDDQNLFHKNVDEVFDQSGRLPILFINTTRVQEGTPAVVSSIKLKNFSERLDVLSLVDSTHESGKGNIQLSTAAVLGARFPYVSPAGGISYSTKCEVRNHSFVDGGYFDNSGGGIVHEMMQRIEEIIKTKATDSLHIRLRKMKFHLIHLTNSPYTESSLNALHPLTNDLAAPLLTVFNTYGSQTTVNDRRLESFLKRLCNCSDTMSTDVNLYRKDTLETYPMNWVISKYQRKRMDERVREVMGEEVSKFFKNN
ncbi:MAG: hypothetical protein ACKVOQ_07935 [Cyclobacteriaceae bacterium]